MLAHVIPIQYYCYCFVCVFMYARNVFLYIPCMHIYCFEWLFGVAEAAAAAAVVIIVMVCVVFFATMQHTFMSVCVCFYC